MSDHKEKEEEEYKPNPKELDGAPDLSMLVYLHMRNVLYNLEYRYSKMPRKYCYSSVSTILVAINPYERLPIYGADVINEFHDAAKKGRLPQGRPHPYGVSARSYMRMIQRKCNQSVIVCGESGAGKTETTKLLMRYLAMTAPTVSMEESIVEQQIIAASPILEAYGNAKTVLNNNSSRFGKFTKLLYNVPEKARFGTILGSYLETYLLEKSRVVFQASNERNYHIYYFMHAGIEKSKHASYFMDKCENYNYTNQGNSCAVPGISDLARYEELTESLVLMRIDEGLQHHLWEISSGIFNLGNVEFTREGDGFAAINKKCPKFIHAVAELWGMTDTMINDRLLTKNMKVMKKTITQRITYEKSITNRDSIAKGIYENIFLWLAKRINAELYQTEENVQSVLFIGILDVFGFENFYINSLEQFCINFTNEKLQQFFNYHIIKSEQEEYIKESVFWTPLSVPDNINYVHMVENKDHGFFALLDSACKAPKPSTEAFMQELFKKNGSNPCLAKITAPGVGMYRGGPTKKSSKNKNKNRKKTRRPKARFEGFSIVHFADDVGYDIQHFLTKNMESVHSDTAKMMGKSTKALTAQIGGPVAGQKKSKRKRSVTSVFFSGIKILMKNLSATEPYFVRCVNPNKQKSSKVWNLILVEHQLRCGGLVEALKVLKLGYPTRVPYATLFDKYHGNVTNPLIKNMGPEAFSTALLIAFDVSENDYELGLTKIFFKPSKAAVLEVIMSQADKPLSVAQNAKITKWVVQKRIKQMMGTCKAFLDYRKRVRLTRASRRWQFAGRVASLLGGSVLNHLYMAREIILKRKREEASVKMQAFFRGSYERSRYIKHIVKVKKSITIIWISYRRWQERVNLSAWLDKKVEETRIRKAEEERIRKEIEKARIEEEKRMERERILEEKRHEAERQRNQALMAEEERQAEIERLKKEAEQLRLEAEKERVRVEEERKAEMEKLREEAEKLRLEAEKRKQEELEQKREEERLKKEEDERIRLEEEAKKIEQEKEEARKRIEQKSMALQQEKQIIEIEKREHKRRKREASIKTNKKRRRKREADRQDEEDAKFIKKNLIEMDSDESSYDNTDESYSEESDEPIMSVKDQLKNFDKIASTGQLFLKYTGKRRRKPQDRIVKVSFDNNYKPKQISWGSGSRHIDFSDILYIAQGHWTPVFQARTETLDKKLCFSVVGKQQILDVQAQTKDMAELWVRGLRRLIGQTDEQALKLCKQNLESGNLPGFKNKDQNEQKRAEKEHKRRTKSLMLLQQDLFVMTTTTVYRNLDEERIWDIDQQVREQFNAKSLYEQALREDIPWRQWNHWIREKIVTYLRTNNRIAAHPYGSGGYQQPQQFQAQPVYNQQPQQYQQPQYAQPQNFNPYQQPQQQYNPYQQPQQPQQPMYQQPQARVSNVYNQGGGGFQQPQHNRQPSQPRQVQRQGSQQMLQQQGSNFNVLSSQPQGQPQSGPQAVNNYYQQPQAQPQMAMPPMQNIPMQGMQNMQAGPNGESPENCTLM